MNKERALKFSVVLNVVLVFILIGGYSKLNFATLRVLTDVAHNLSELEQKISYQNENDWNNPTLVTTELEEVLYSIQRAQKIGSETKTLSTDDVMMLSDLGHELYELHPLPNGSLDRHESLKDGDIVEFERLGGVLEEVGLDMPAMVRKDDWSKDNLLKLTNNLADSLSDEQETSHQK